MAAAVDTPAPVRVRATPPDRWLWWGMAVLILVGLGLTASVVWIGNQLAAPSGTATTASNLIGCGPETPCADVLRSAYSAILGKSLTKWSIGYYLLVAAAMLAAVYAWQLSLAQPLSLMLPVVTFFGVVASGWCVAMMVWALRAYCYWCFTVHAVNLALFGLALVYAIEDWRFRQHTRWQAGVPPLPVTPVVIHVAVALMLGATQLTVMNLFHSDQREPIPDVEDPKQRLGVDSRVEINLPALMVDSARRDGGAVGETIWTTKGPRNAPHRIVVFCCLTSPHCRNLNALLNDVMARHPGQLRVDFRFYPLWHGCNVTIPKGASDATHKHACELTRSALAVAMLKPEAFAGYVDWLYENQATMDETQAAKEASSKVGGVAWRKAMDDPVLWKRLREDVEMARQLGIQTAPRMYLESGQVYGEVKQSNLDELLSRQFAWQPVAGAAKDKEPVWLASDVVAGHAKRAVAHMQMGRHGEAVIEWKEATQIKPDWTEAALELSRILATSPNAKVRNGDAAVYYARLALKHSKEKTPLMYDVYAAALAENGNFREAVSTARMVMELYNQAESKSESEEVRKRLEMYIQGRAYRMPQ